MDSTNRRWYHEDMDNTKPKLPKLPPLITTQYHGEGFRKEKVSIGWPQMSPSPITPISTPTSQVRSPPRSHPEPPARRPPPPPLPSNVNARGLSTPTTFRSPNQFNSVSSPSSTNSRNYASYRSPFVGEDDLRYEVSSASVANNTSVYKSPFIGDASNTIIKDIRHDSSSSNFRPESASTLMSNSFASELGNDSLPSITYVNNEPIDDMTRTMKALPALPARKNINVLTNSQAHYESSSPLTDKFLRESANESDFYKPPPPLSASLRTPSDGRTISGSVSSYYSNSNYAFNDESARQSSFNSIVGGKPLQQVPSITAPTQPFSIDFLDENKLYQCYRVSLLSDIYEWLLKVYFEWFNEYVFPKISFFQMVQLLLEFQLPTSCDQDVVDSNVDKIIDSLVSQGAVRFQADTEKNSNDEMTFIVAGLNVQGVFTELLDCYSYEGKQLAEAQDNGCYCPRCPAKFMKEIRPNLKLSEIINKSVGVWTDYWKLTADELSEISPREVKRQSFIFDLILLEERSLNLANAATEIYGKKFHASFLPQDPNFSQLAFDPFVPLIELHKEYLLSPIFGKLKTRGKFIDGVGKIYLKWCNEAREAYLHYAESMATVHEIINWEKMHNTKFAQWLKEIDNSPEITRSKLYHDVIFFGGFFKSLQNMPVTLNSILKCTDQSMEDYEYLKMAISDIENLNAVVDQVHGIAVDQRKVVRFSRQLIVGNRSNSSTISYVNINEDGKGASVSGQDKLDLKLNEKSRRLLKSGTVFKKRELWLEGSPLFIVLLDNYFLITETVNKGNEKKYKLSERPIPIDYLSLETKEKEFNASQLTTYNLNDLEGSSYVNDTKPNESLTTPVSMVKPHLVHAANSMPFISKGLHHSTTAYTLDETSENWDSTASFKVRNTATNESFTFLTATLDERDSWVAAIVMCFRKHNSNDLHVFGLKCLTDMFSYDENQAPTNLPVAPEGSVIDIALKKYYTAYPGLQAPLNADVSCSVKFSYEGKAFILCGVNHGIYMTISDNLTSWKRILTLSKVTRMQINTKLGLLFVLADRKLCYFNLPSVLCAYYNSSEYLVNNQLIGILLNEKITFFKVADDFGNSRHLFYERKGKITILTPEFDRLSKTFKFFKIYKEFKLPSSSGIASLDVKDIIIFKKSFIVCSSKGSLLFNESFNDDGMILPSFLNDSSFTGRHHHFTHYPFKSTMETSSKKNSSKQKMAEYVKIDLVNNKTAPICCFQISSDDFIIVYDEAVIKINRQGEIPDWKTDILVLDFYCTGATLNNEFLILVGDNLIQIYDFNYLGNIVNNKLSKLAPIQIIKGKKVKLINSQINEDAVIVLSHPNIAGRQLVLEFYQDK